MIVQLLAWLALLGAASTVRLGWLRRRRRLTDLDEGPVLRLGTLEPGAGSMFDPFARPAQPDADEEESDDGEPGLPVAVVVEEPVAVPVDVPADEQIDLADDEPASAPLVEPDPLEAFDDVYGPGPFGSGPFEPIAPPALSDAAPDDAQNVDDPS